MIDTPFQYEGAYPLYVSAVGPEGVTFAVADGVYAELGGNNVFTGTNTFNGFVTINSTLFFGTTINQSIAPAGTLVLPTCTGSGPPTWTPTYIGTTIWSNSNQTYYTWNGSSWVSSSSGGTTQGRSWEHYRHIGPMSVFSGGRKRWHPVTVHSDCGFISGSMDTDKIFAEPWISPTGQTIQKICVELRSGTYFSGSPTTAGVIMAIYETDTSFTTFSAYPTNRVLLCKEVMVDYLAGGTGRQQVRFTKDYAGDDISFTFDPQKLYWFAFNRDFANVSDLWTMTSLAGGAAADVLGCAISVEDGLFKNPATHIIIEHAYDVSGDPDTDPTFALPAIFPVDGEAVANDGSNSHIVMFLWYEHPDDDPGDDP